MLRATYRGRTFLKLTSREKLRFGRILLRDREVGWPARVVVLLLVGYLALPIDLIPDFLPIVGRYIEWSFIGHFIALALLGLICFRHRDSLMRRSS